MKVIREYEPLPKPEPKPKAPKSPRYIVVAVWPWGPEVSSKHRFLWKARFSAWTLTYLSHYEPKTRIIDTWGRTISDNNQ